MSKFIIGKKLEMSQVFASDGRVIPVTKVLAGPCFVTYVKTQDKDGYSAVQIGFDNTKKVSRAVRGHLKNLGPFRTLREFKVEAGQNLKLGQELRVNIFTPQDVVHVTGLSKGKGFQGVVKRWGFHGSPKSHGHKDQERMPGSIGAGGEQRVKKGTRMGGRMGTDRVTVKNLQIIEVDTKNNILSIKGAIPGRKKSLVLVYGPGEIKLEEKESQINVEEVQKVAEAKLQNNAEETQKNADGAINDAVIKDDQENQSIEKPAEVTKSE